MAVQPATLVRPIALRTRVHRFRIYMRMAWPLYVMVVPALLFLAVFSYFPMYGVIIAFQNYNPALGFIKSPWVGLANFRFMLALPDFWQITANTLIIAVLKIVTVQVFAICFALMLNEVKHTFFKRSVQTLTYLPHFLSWVVLAGILIDMLSTTGLVNRAIMTLGFQPIVFLGSNTWFRPVIIVSNMWQTVGWSAIIYLAALMSIDPQLHEAAAIDGASRLGRVRHVTLPGIAGTIVLLAVLALGSVLNAGFEQILNLYNPVVYPTGDILDTYVYRAGLISAQFSLAGAVGLAKSVVSLVLIVIAWKMADKYAGYRLF
jgi:putative aldouronate transport system permease protein